MKELKREFPRLEKSALRDFVAKRDATTPLVQQLALRPDWVLVDEQVLGRFGTDPHKYWERFYRKFRGSAGRVSPSRVGFNATKSQALVYVLKSYGDVGADGGWYFLEKKAGQWKLRKRYLNFFS